MLNFKLQNPLKGSKLTYHTEGGNITQFFGENPELYAKAIPGYPAKMGHNGIDIAMPYGTPVCAAHDGTILGIAESNALGGNQIYLHSFDFLDGGITYKVITGYAHLSKIKVIIGQKVKCGDIIGEEGNSGFVISTATPYWDNTNPTAGAHLHFSLSFNKKIAPDKYEGLKNEYGTASVDPAPYLGIQTKNELIISKLTLLKSLYEKLISLIKKNE